MFTLLMCMTCAIFADNLSKDEKTVGAISVDKTVAFEGPWKTEEFTQEWKTLRSAVGRKVCGNAEHVYCNKHGVCHDLSSAI